MRYEALIIIFLTIMLSVQVAYSYDNYNVHPTINQNALFESNIDGFLKEQLGLPDGINHAILVQSHGSKKKIKELFAEGGTREDEPACRCRHHFHDPLRQWAQAGLESYFFNT
ncbi:MAG: hypothetical protein ACYTBP_16435, partial [Planctomycetota bacterium]